MVARPGIFQSSNNAGELKPELHHRTDLKSFYSGLAYARNIEPVPQGGSRLAPRSRHLARIRRQVEAVPVDTSSQNLTAVSGVATLAQINFFGLSPVAMAAVTAFTASPAIGAIVRFEALLDGVWTPFGPIFGGDNGPRTRTASTPPGAPVLCTAIRLRLYSAPAGATDFTLGAVTAYFENATVPAPRLVPFTFADTQTYVLVLGDRFADIYRDGAFTGSAWTGIGADKLALLDVQQRLDTALLFHPDIAPVRLLRDGADNNWATDAIPFTNMPLVDLGASYGNQVADMWTLYVRYPLPNTVTPSATSFYVWGGALSVQLTVNGEPAAAVNTGGLTVAVGPNHIPDWNAFALGLKAAIEALASVGPGVTVTPDISQFAFGSVSFTISFGGDNLGGVNTMAATVLNTVEAAATVAHTTIGDPGGEPLTSAGAGYPACGIFFQDRLITAGFRSKRGAWLASVTGDYFNQNVKLVAASGAILENIDTDGAERVQYMARSRHLMIFTSDAEYFVSDSVLARTAQPNVVNSSRNGSAPGIPPVENEGSLLYVSKLNTLLFNATYDAVSTAYVSTPISLLASHIVSGLVAMAIQRANSDTDAARLWMPRADGSMTLGTVLRGESVVAFTRWETPGLVVGACVDGRNVPHIVVARDVAGSPEYHFERLELGLIFDAAVEQTFGAPTTTITGLGMHEGHEVWALLDGYIAGPFTVGGGQITVNDPSTHVLVGRWTPPLARALPLSTEVNQGVVLQRPIRVHTVRLDLVDTTSVAIGANGLPARNVALARVTDPADTPLAPQSRPVAVTGLKGFSPGGQIEITQTKPGRLAWSGFTREARK